ncbi:MAG TPA: hypothetical protein VE619_11255 [Nitrososphaeraceae archaeon]|nr:hypothetical protein [Nitrososphaeraceae archaeon]
MVPVLVEISDDAFRAHTGQLQDARADGIIIDTVEMTAKEELYKGKHAIAVIHYARYIINQ